MRLRGTLLLSAVGLQACGSQSRPPYIDDGIVETPNHDAAVDTTPEFVKPPPTGDAPCETVVELPVVKPNFYFVLDASGSMLDPMPGETVNRYQSAIQAINTMLSGVKTRVNFGAALFPHPLDGASCNAGSEVFALNNVPHPGSQQGTSLEALLLTLAQYAPEGGSPISSTLAAIRPALVEAEGPTSVFLLTDGAPNCNPDVVCEAKDCIPNIEGVLIQEDLRCDDALNCCQPGWFPHLCLDDAATDNQLTALAAANVLTYVIGMPGSTTYSSLLDQMAVAAGTARKDEDLLYYQINDAAELAETLAALSQEILIACELPLDFAPTNPDLVHVYAADDELPADTWRLSGADTVELLGDTCSQWKSGKLAEIRVRQTCIPVVR